MTRAGTLYTRTLSTFAAGVCTMGAVVNAADGRAWWSLTAAAFAAFNGYFASQTTMRLIPPEDQQ